MPDSVDAATVRRWCAAGLDALRHHQGEIDALNVYPVPDGDTGTNLVLTMGAAVESLDAAVVDAALVEAAPGGSLGAVLRVAARGALLGARGNSGIILAQLFKGLAEALAEADEADGALLARALEHAARTAYQAVAAPVEGTVLSVGAAAARAALTAAGIAAPGPEAANPTDGPQGAVARSGAVRGGGLVGVARAAAEGARVALARTPEQLPALARAGVVDAGGLGLVVLLEALVQTLTGEAPPPAAPARVVPPAAPGTVVPGAGGTGTAGPAGRPGGAMEREAGSEQFAYEVQYLLEADDEAVERLRRGLAGFGDSLVVVGDAPTWHVHVHVNDVGAAIEAGIEAGRPSRISVTRFADQIVGQPAPRSQDGQAQRQDEPAQGRDEWAGDERAGNERARDEWAGNERAGDGGRARDRDGRPQPQDEPAQRHDEQPHPHDDDMQRHDRQRQQQERAVVVVCSGPGLRELLAAEGATVLTGTPSTGEIIEAIRSTGAGRVVVLPNDPNGLAVAATAAAEARAGGVRAGVVPTRSPVQALAAMAVRDARRRFEDDVIAMAEAAARCRSAEVTIASREALTVAGRCQPGDVLAIVDGEVNLIGQDLAGTACQLLDRMLTGGGELVTLIAGQGAPARLGETLRAHVADAWPFVEVQCYEGGQPHYPLLVGVE